MLLISTKIKCLVLLLDHSWCAAASGTEADDTDGPDQTMELDSLTGMQTALAQTNFLDFFFSLQNGFYDVKIKVCSLHYMLNRHLTL